MSFQLTSALDELLDAYGIPIQSYYFYRNLIRLQLAKHIRHYTLHQKKFLQYFKNYFSSVTHMTV